MNYQSGILEPVPAQARYLTFKVKEGAAPAASLKRLTALADGDTIVIGIGAALAQGLNGNIPGLKPFPAFSKAVVDTPITHGDLWCWLRGEDRGTLANLGRDVEVAVAEAFERIDCRDAFRHGSGRDLSGYEDGTENPEGEEAVEAAILTGAGKGLDGSSFVATQVWDHDLTHFKNLPQTEQDHIIGRRLADNEELEDAPESAHVKRTEQESFSPHAIVSRRSMPWADSRGEGLYFVAFGHDYTAFEAQLSRMVGEEDGIADALYQFSKPVTGAYFWCPPVTDGALDLSALGL